MYAQSSSIQLALPFCNNYSQEEQTKLSCISRTIAIGLGSIALLAGIFILCGISSISSLGTAAGCLFITLGGLALLTGRCLRCVKQQVRDEHLPFDFAKITPENYKEYIDLSRYNDKEEGEIHYKEKVHDGDDSYVGAKKRDILGGYVTTKNSAGIGWFWGITLEIRDGQFIHYPQMSKQPKFFSNLKEFFDYLFQGDFYQGEVTRNMESFTLRTATGEKVRYYNPSLLIQPT